MIKNIYEINIYMYTYTFMECIKCHSFNKVTVKWSVFSSLMPWWKKLSLNLLVPDQIDQYLLPDGSSWTVTVTGVTWVFDNPSRFPQAPLAVDVLEGGKLPSYNHFGTPHCSPKSFAVVGSVVAIPSSDASSEDGLNGTAVEGLEDWGAHAESVQSPEKE